MQHNQTKRKPHKRSRKGCTRCKNRHVRCDEEVPICGNCFKYGHECSLSEARPFEIDIMSPNDFASREPEEQQDQATTPEKQHQQPQEQHQSQYPQYSQQPQSSQQAQQVQYAQYSQATLHTQSYESSYTHAVPYHDPLRTDLTPEAVSALNCYLQVCAESPQSAYGNRIVRTEEDPREPPIPSASSLHSETTHYLQAQQMKGEDLHMLLRDLLFRKAVDTMQHTNIDAALVDLFCFGWGAPNW